MRCITSSKSVVVKFSTRTTWPLFAHFYMSKRELETDLPQKLSFIFPGRMWSLGHPIASHNSFVSKSGSNPAFSSPPKYVAYTTVRHKSEIVYVDCRLIHKPLSIIPN